MENKSENFNFEYTMLQDITDMIELQKQNKITNYFINKYKLNCNDEKKTNVIFNIMSECLKCVFDNIYIKIFCTDITKKTILKKFIKKYDEYLMENKDKQDIYDKIVSTIHDTYYNNPEVIEKILSFVSFKQLALSCTTFNNGYELEKKTIFGCYKNNNKYNNNDLNMMIKSFDPITNDEFMHDKIVTVFWCYLTTNKVYLQTFKPAINCSSTKFIFIITKILILIFEQYDYKKMMENIMKDERKYIINDYCIDDMNFLNKLYITTLYSFAILFNTLKMTYLQNNTALFIIGNDTISFDNKKLLNNIDYNTIEKILFSYDRIYDKIQSIEILDNILFFIATVARHYETRERTIYTNNMSIFLTNILGKNEGMTDFLKVNTLECIIDCINYNEIYDNKNELINNIFNYINKVDIYKEMCFPSFIKHLGDIIYLLIKLIKTNVMIVTDELKKTLTKTLFKIINYSFLIYETTENIIVNNMLHSSEILNSLNNNILDCFCLIETIIKCFDIKIFSSDFERQLSLYIIHVFNKIISNKEISKKFNTTLIKNITSQLFCILNLYCTDNILSFLFEIKKPLLDYITTKCKTNKKNNTIYKIKTKFNNYNFTDFVTKLTNYELVDVSYPDEFLDPITYSLITDPIFIPHNNYPHDKTTILTQINYNSKNPYSDDHLTETLLIEYNNTPEIIEKINVFNDTFNKWKISNGI
jgi:hypothetical protein